MLVIRSVPSTPTPTQKRGKTSHPIAWVVPLAFRVFSVFRGSFHFGNNQASAERGLLPGAGAGRRPALRVAPAPLGQAMPKLSLHPLLQLRPPRRRVVLDAALTPSNRSTRTRAGRYFGTRVGSGVSATRWYWLGISDADVGIDFIEKIKQA